VSFQGGSGGGSTTETLRTHRDHGERLTSFSAVHPVCRLGDRVRTSFRELKPSALGKVQDSARQGSLEISTFRPDDSLRVQNRSGFSSADSILSRTRRPDLSRASFLLKERSENDS
jgi:hypothetical protein